MKFKTILSCIVGLAFCFSSNAQILDELKKLVGGNEEKEETTQVSEETRNIMKGFFTMDVVMATYNKEGELVQTSYFDKDKVVMKTDMVGKTHPVYHDSSGKNYLYDRTEETYKAVKLLSAGSMGMMTAGLTTEAYQLPKEPYLNAFETMANHDLALGFMVLELAFIYKPEHFRNSGSYKESSGNCSGNTCTKFSYTNAEYDGSYIMFDAKERIREFNIVTTKKEMYGQKIENSEGKFIYSYKPVSVELPESQEQSLVPGELGKIIPLDKGLEPWKHNKKDKKKNN